jgi:hypothetical protein
MMASDCRVISGRTTAWLMTGTLVLMTNTAPAQFTGVVNPGEFDEVAYWVGNGSNSAAVVIDFHDGKVAHSYGWGVRWDGVLNGEDALRMVVQADPRLEWNTQQFAFGLAVYGMHFDANGTGGAFEFTGSDGGTVEDPEDHLQNGFLTDGFWAFYSTEESPTLEPWQDSMVGAGGRFLSDGSWDGWAFAPGYVMNAPRNPVQWVQPPVPYLESITLTDYTTAAPQGFTTQPIVSVELTGAYGEEIRLSETSGGGDWIALDGEPLTFVLSAGDGEKTVYATLRREGVLSGQVSATIHLASGYNFPTIVLPMRNPVVTDHLVFDVTYEEPTAGALLNESFAIIGTLAGSAEFDTAIDEDPSHRLIVRLADAEVDGSLGISAPVLDGAGNRVATINSATYGIVNGTAQYERGDYNMDGVVNVEDVTALANDLVNR